MCKQKHCPTRKLNREDAIGRGRWKKLIKLGYDQDGGWVSVSSGTGSPRLSQTKGRKTVAVVLVVLIWQCQLMQVVLYNRHKME